MSSDSQHTAAGDGYVERQVRRASLNLLIWNGLVLGLVLAGAWFSGGYYYYFFTGPVRMDDAAILAAAENPGRGNFIAYIELLDQNLQPTGYVEESTSDGRVYSAIPYFFLPAGDKLMLVKTYAAADGKRLVGPLQRLAVKTDLDARDSIARKHPELADRILPIMLNGAAAYKVAGYVGLGIFVPVALLCGFNVARACLGLGTPALHPVARTLSRYGDPREVAHAIDREITEGPARQFGPVTLTSLWLLRPAAFGLIAIRLADVVWAYHLVLSGRNLAVVALRNGKIRGIPLQTGTPELLAEIYARVPWVERNYDSARMKMWRTRRAKFIAEVDERRKGHVGS